MDDPILCSLIFVQVFMAAFDTLVHHEGVERPAWRASQKLELRSHGVRNLLYAIIFIAFAWIEPHGVFAVIFTGVLTAAILITLRDFVEVGQTRKLPASERINHNLLVLNFGAILALAAPYLWQWSFQPNALILVSYGWWSVMATATAIGASIFSAHYLLAASRSDRLDRGDPADLVATLKSRQNILITGGTGFIGTRLVEALVAGRHYVTVLTRDPKSADELTHPVRVISSLDMVDNDDYFDVIVNLAGESIAGGIWTKKRRARIIASRVDMTRAVNALIERLQIKPECLVNGSAIGWYGLQDADDDTELTEDAQAEPAFVHDICEAWEQATVPISNQGVRVVIMRIGLVLGVDGGMLAKLLTPFEFGGGGIMGSGQQWMSWIEHDDLIRAICFAISTPGLSGPINAVTPAPERNDTFSRDLASALCRPLLLRYPTWLMEGAFGDLGKETMLAGQRVVPERLLKHGFEFRHSKLAPTLKKITGAEKSKRSGVLDRKGE